MGNGHWEEEEEEEAQLSGGWVGGGGHESRVSSKPYYLRHK